MNSLLHIVCFCIDVVFPPSEEMILVRDANASELVTRTRVRHKTHATSLLPFSDPLVRACIHETKFHENKKAAKLLGIVLREYINSLSKNEHLLIPIPLSAARMRTRGYNQVTIIAKEAFEQTSNVAIREDILIRTRNTKPQTDLPKKKRLQNVTDAFGVRDESIKAIAGAHIILLDDVITTGATMDAAYSELLRHHPASVTCLALAH